MITHDMRSPLTSLLSNLQMLRKGAYGVIEQKSSDKVDIMVGNCRQLLAFINDLLVVDRLESGSFELELKTTSAEAILQKAVSVVDGAATSKRIELLVSSKPGLNVVADEARVVQVLVNLLSNALKFSDSGTRINITSSSIDDCCRFSVRE